MPQQVPLISPSSNQRQLKQLEQKDNLKAGELQHRQHSDGHKLDGNEGNGTTATVLKADSNSISNRLATSAGQADTQLDECDDATDKPYQTIDVDDFIPPIDDDNSNDEFTNNNTNTNTTTTTANPDEFKPQQSAKLNGLKNRIIQRPPPLVLDKVSNFYYNSTDNYADQSKQLQHNQQQHQQLQLNSAANATTANAMNEDTAHNIDDGNKQNRSQQAISRSKSNPIQQTSHQTDDASSIIVDRTSSSNGNNNNNGNGNANQKFWASLNENASRNKALANARTISSFALTSSNTPFNGTSAFSTSTLPHHTQSNKDTTDSLGLDLIIKHRNSNSSSHLPTTTGRANHHNGRRHHNQQVYPPPPSGYNTQNRLHDIQSVDSRKTKHIEQSGRKKTEDHNESGNHRYRGTPGSLNETDDGGAPSENGGGNLIGVDNSTPPAIDQQQQHQENPPQSASSSRPRSNNPFLDDDQLDDQKVETQHGNNGLTTNTDDLRASPFPSNNFHKRPASFIAATADRSAVPGKQSAGLTRQETIEEKFNEFKLHDQQMGPSTIHHTAAEHPYGQTIYHQPNQNPIEIQAQNLEHQMTSYQASVDTNSNNYHELLREPEISVDSESTVCQPPPSATMQLPHWTEAIYQLNNAILEPNSVAGGAENGQFIHFAESGNIILELDHIKVSGFTLVEFNELVESKQFHLLSAVQTKHSHGLTDNLKNYLNSSFSRDSKDRELQNVIRENIYRRTIPCTTRPPRQGEVDKVDYHYLTKEQFIDLNNRDMLLECGNYGDHYYGTLKPLCDLTDLTTYSSTYSRDVSDGSLQQPWDANHPAVGMMMRKDTTLPYAQNINADYPLYENYDSLKAQQQHQQQQQLADIYSTSLQQHSHSHSQQQQHPGLPAQSTELNTTATAATAAAAVFNIVAVDSEALPPGWERVVDQTHGTYYIDHNTKRTQYERPYEVELTKGSMGFGFTLVEADNGLLLVRSIIHGGPAHMNGSIRPGDILVSAVGVLVSGLQHTDIARLFSTFAVGDRVRLTFARSNYVLDDTLVPDEYLFSNGTDGNMAVAFNSSNNSNITLQQAQVSQDAMQSGAMVDQSPHILVNQEFEFAKISLKRGDQGFGFTICDSIAGQKVRKIQNHEVCSDLKQGDILISLDGQDITKLTHKEVVERLKKYTPGQDVALIVKRKKRFRSKTPMAMHTDANSEYSLDSTPQRKCKTPSLDGLMLKRTSDHNPAMDLLVPRRLMQQPSQSLPPPLPVPNSHNGQPNFPDYSTAVIPLPQSQALSDQRLVIDEQQQQQQQIIYGSLPHQQSALIDQQPVYYNQQQQQQHSLPVDINTYDLNNRQLSMLHQVGQQVNQSLSNSVQASEVALPINSIGHNKLIDSDQSQLNQYNDFMHNDKLVMMQMQQQQQQIYNHLPFSSDYGQVPLHAQSEVLRHQALHTSGLLPSIPIKPPMNPYSSVAQPNTINDFQGNYYANNDEIALQSMHQNNSHFNFNSQGAQTPHDERDEHEYHHVELIRENTDLNWGIRLIGGAEVDRAISIGSMISGGVAAKSGKLKSGDEIISIDGVNVVGATHQDVVKLISACTVRVMLVVRRKAFAEACDVVLSKNMDEGFGFVIISSENCALIGKIIEGSPADRCKQLRVRDCIIAVNGRFITPDMKHPEIVNMIKECGSTLRLRIIPVDCYTVKLIKDVQNDSFGFRMRGGSEYDGTPLYIVRVEPNGQAHGLLNVGDQILEINNIPTVGMTHQQAATIIKYSDPIVKLKLRRNFETPPSLLVDSPRALQKYNQVTAEMKTVSQTITPNPLAGSIVDLQPERYSNNYASLPIDVNLINQQQQQLQQQQQQQQHQTVNQSSNSINGIDHLVDGQQQQQPIYEQHHSMNYSGSRSLYAT